MKSPGRIALCIGISAFVIKAVAAQEYAANNTFRSAIAKKTVSDFTSDSNRVGPGLRTGPASSEFHKDRFALAISTEAALYAGSMSGLYVLWYKNYPQSAFHFVNDNNDWLQMDKVGHATTSYYIGKLAIDVLNWTGLDPTKSILLGAGTGLLFQETIEVLDGFSKEWGYSKGDMLANITGTTLLLSQAFAWNEQRIQPKFSFYRSPYAQYRPEELGSNLTEQIIKDYNGQTYWLSGNISSFLNKNSHFPKWLNIALGYGADGMTGGSYNPAYNSKGETIPSFERRRQFYLSLDADLTRIPTRSRFLKTLFTTIGFIKIPAPTIEFTEQGKVKYYMIYL